MTRGIRRVVYPSLFWDSLASLRGHSRYTAVRAQIDELLVAKKNGVSQMNKRDKPFNPRGPLSNVWHWACCRNPDIVVFYTVEAGTLTMAMVGDHHDYAFQGRGARASERTATRIANAVSSRHVPSPEWKSLSWKKPSDITHNPDLYEVSKDTLDSLRLAVNDELDNGHIFERMFGKPILSAEASVFDAWMDDAEQALAAIGAAARMVPSTPEEALEAAIERRAAAMSR